ncbi:Pancreatic lipase-related protein 3 [Araneus ventricosus]|uniref:Pancreatic lipase-related protein 3 n=1 Tax=Araneus ventricosus TaxID=182803 RepID=A0A4Y2EFR8_ARAVE|nr:Pancreatic lipase-related protein 3 [Araneus ventricosus]
MTLFVLLKHGFVKTLIPGIYSTIVILFTERTVVPHLIPVDVGGDVLVAIKKCLSSLKLDVPGLDLEAIWISVKLNHSKKDLKDQFLLSADENVIVVDTSSLSLLLVPRIIYPQAVADSRAIGVQVEQLITFLHERLDVDMGKVHIIGHSLGAHVGGYAGERLPKLGRITGLDPAGPWYRKVPRNVQLDDADATFVDVIHSNPAPLLLFGFGTVEDRGHTNFWPSGGIQRGYFPTLLRAFFNAIFPTEPVGNTVNWAHARATEFFLYSFNQSNCLPVGVECRSWSEFLQGQCNCGLYGERCSFMGMFATPKSPPKRRYYLQVARERPYCLHQYQIVVYLQTARNVAKSVQALTEITIFGENHLLQKELLLNIDLSTSRQINTFFATSFQRLGKIRSVEVASIEGIATTGKALVEAIEVNYLYPEMIHKNDPMNSGRSLPYVGPLGSYRAGLFKTVCYPDVGCFYTGPPFFQLPQRPIIRPPLPPQLIGTTFLLFTRKNMRSPAVVAPDELESIFKSHLNPVAWTRVIIHGYLDGSYSMSWMLNLKDEFLRSADDNVIVVDSSSLSLLLLHRIPITQAATDTRVIGVQIAQFLAFLHNRSVLLENEKEPWKYNVGVPQGSCAGPILWLSIANEALNKFGVGTEVKVQAFADDFVVLIGSTASFIIFLKLELQLWLS